LQATPDVRETLVADALGLTAQYQATIKEFRLTVLFSG
jgi:hypothetical protein